jgi:ATP-dependent DNA helicase RecG
LIEIGIDVPQASVMMVEGAERFGLAQLHQIRGRVGRGSAQAYCILMSDGAHTDKARRRLQVMTETNDGFEIATADLDLRGEGDILGTRQSGMPEFRVADLIRDAAVLETARQDAMSLIREDPTLKRPEHQALRVALRERWVGRLDLVGA